MLEKSLNKSKIRFTWQEMLTPWLPNPGQKISHILKARSQRNCSANSNFINFKSLRIDSMESSTEALNMPFYSHTLKSILYWLRLGCIAFLSTALIPWQWWSVPRHPTGMDISPIFHRWFWPSLPLLNLFPSVSLSAYPSQRKTSKPQKDWCSKWLMKLCIDKSSLLAHMSCSSEVPLHKWHTHYVTHTAKGLGLQ